MNDNLIRLLEDVELAGDRVLTTRQEIIDLDRKRNSNREAIRGLQRLAKEHYKGDKSKVWIAAGNTFIKLENETARQMLDKDQKQLDITVNTLRSSLKDRVNELREKEGQDELKGFNLTALTSDELGMVNKTIQDNIPLTRKYPHNQF
eukprot:TRINITY_DN36423_c0_g1_i1.p1 TRINITY_DN36423_c0_g1~~TRINITY_DN36423_c0_g1_i1.p1  ORF type:complete len:148 (+),score=37.23 TRINITY_DN36423_c0_g1_i1:143-586(+)